MNDKRESQRAYFASLIDQRGHIIIERSRRSKGIYRSLRLVVKPLTSSVASWVSENFLGGKFIGNSDSCGLIYVTREAAAILAEVYPYLIEKREVAKLVFDFVRTVGC